MEKLVPYIPYIVAVLFIGIIAIYNLIKRPEKIKEWLIWACAQAEQELGSGTGQLKLRAVYDMFIKQFPIMALIISFERFSGWVDGALEQLTAWIADNIDVKMLFEYVDEDEVIEENEE